MPDTPSFLSFIWKDYMKSTHCLRGHERTPENRSSDGGCRPCHATRERKRRTHCRLGHARTSDNLYPNGTCKKCAITRAGRWNRENIDSRLIILRKSLLKTRYKLSEKDYQTLFEKQGNVCAVCKRSPHEGKLLVVDHDHDCCSGFESCGKCIRGLLHPGCNVALGIFQNSPEVFKNAIEYIENPPGKDLIKIEDAHGTKSRDSV